jgi:uncharacterized BrkB/YihY/UPF0761 family membrane protein
MATQTHRALRIILGLLCLFAAAAGLLMIFAGKPLMIRLFLSPPESEFSTLLLFTLKQLGGIILMFSVLCFYAARDPVRNVAIIDALIVGLCVLALTQLLSLYTTDVQQLYPHHLLWGRPIVRLLVAALFFYLRPRESTSAQT